MSLPASALLSPKGNYVVLYQITEVGHVGISRFSFDPKSQVIFRYADRPGPKKGQLERPSSIAAVYVNDLPVVYGSVDFVDDTKIPAVTYKIATQISPQLYSIADKDLFAFAKLPTDNTSIAATSDSDDQVWVYYFQQASAADSPLVLTEASIVNSELQDPVKTITKDGVIVHSNSRLAATFFRDSKKKNNGRVVFYQQADSEGSAPLRAVTQGTNSGYDNTPIPGTNNALKQTPLAAVTVGEAPQHTIYLYYLDSASRIHRVVWSDSSWGEPKQIAGANTEKNLISNESALTAVAGKDAISLFYVIKNQKGGKKDYSFYLHSFEDKE